jgi:hypothetical protein
MKYIITESQKEILFLKRRLNDPEINTLLTGIIEEGYWYTDPCDYSIYDYHLYKEAIIFGSVQTFINSYEELYKNKDIDKGKLEKFVYKFIDLKFEDIIRKDWDERECDEDDDEDDMFL